MKTCTRCKQELPLDAFLNSSNGRGLYGKRSQCRECQTKYKQQLRADAITEGVRTCLVCDKTKPVTDFYRESNKSGRAKTCKVCYRQKAKAQYIQRSKQDKELINAKAKDRYHTDKDYRQRVLKSSSEWGKKNREKINKTTREWHKRNPYKCSEYHARRRAQKALNGGNFIAEAFEGICKQYNYKCLCCGSNDKLTADHIVPVAGGGTNDISNIQPLCMSCNASKQDKTIDYRR